VTDVKVRGSSSNQRGHRTSANRICFQLLLLLNQLALRNESKSVSAFDSPHNQVLAGHDNAFLELLLLSNCLLQELLVLEYLLDWEYPLLLDLQRLDWRHCLKLTRQNYAVVRSTEVAPAEAAAIL